MLPFKILSFGLTTIRMLFLSTSPGVLNTSLLCNFIINFLYILYSNFLELLIFKVKTQKSPGTIESFISFSTKHSSDFAKFCSKLCLVLSLERIVESYLYVGARLREHTTVTYWSLGLCFFCFIASKCYKCVLKFTSETQLLLS